MTKNQATKQTTVQTPRAAKAPTDGRPKEQPAQAAAVPPMSIQEAQMRCQSVLKEVSNVIVGKRNVLEYVMVGILSEGSHILFEDVPGLAKSVMASAFARASGASFRRIQFTPDLLPSDITGNYVYDQKTSDFEFREGPIFSNILLADEINRASPKTQSALLEAMAEKQVSSEGVTRALDKPFVVLATQNPVEQEGTYPLPEAQMDRFAMKLSMGYSNLDEEVEILRRRIRRGKDEFDVAPVIDPVQIVRMQKAAETVKATDEILYYIGKLVVASREHPLTLVGSSPRGSLALLKLARSHAVLHGRTFVTPANVKAVAVQTLAHRLILKPEARIKNVKSEQVVEEILAKVPVPKV